jgi:AcrR family transcriptional regulator
MARDDVFSARGQILLGAAAAFGAKGYAEASVEDILDAAKVSRRTFYRSFRSKEDVFEQLFEAAAILFVQAIRSAASTGGDPAATIERCIDAYLDLPRTAGPLFHVFHHEANRPGSPLYARRERVIDELVEMFDAGHRAVYGTPGDRLLIRGLIAGLERISTYTNDLVAAKAAMMSLVRAVFAR